MKNLIATNNRLQTFALNFDMMSRSVDERVALYHGGHHSIDEQLHDAELQHTALVAAAEVATQIDDVIAALTEFKRDLAKAGVEVGR